MNITGLYEAVTSDVAVALQQDGFKFVGVLVNGESLKTIPSDHEPGLQILNFVPEAEALVDIDNQWNDKAVFAKHDASHVRSFTLFPHT